MVQHLPPDEAHYHPGGSHDNNGPVGSLEPVGPGPPVVPVRGHRSRVRPPDHPGTGVPTPTTGALLPGGFFIGLCNPCQAVFFKRACISINRLRARRTGFRCPAWLMDSGAFTEVTTHGRYREPPAVYAGQVRRWALSKTLLAAVSQDYMCEPFALAATGLTVVDHQRLTVERYDAILRSLGRRPPVPVLPVLQGYAPPEYTAHLTRYDGRLMSGMWVGVGSVCKRNSRPDDVVRVLDGIKSARPDLRLHGFGLKITALSDPRVLALLWSADSMAWSFAARREGRKPNDLREATAYYARVQSIIDR